MHQEQFPKIAELCNRNISRPSCLKTFHTADTDSNMSRLDHGNIVGTVTNGQKQGFEVAFDKLHDQRFLKGRHTTDDKVSF